MAAGLRASAGAPLPPADRDRYAALVAAVRAALGEAAFTAAWAEGQALPLDAAIAAACASTGGPRDPSAEDGPAAWQSDKPAANETATR